MWAPVVRQLAGTHRVLVPDVPGLGESEPLDKLDAEALGGWLTALMAATGFDTPVLVAHSLIGSLAVRSIAEGSGPAVRQLVVYSAPAVGPYRMPMKLRYLAVRFAIRPTQANAESFDRFALADRDATRVATLSGSTPGRPTASIARTPHVKRTMNKLIGPATERILDAALAGMDTPTALLWGRSDRMVAVSVGEAASRALGWPLYIIEDAGHAPHLEQSDRFVDALREVVSLLASSSDNSSCWPWSVRPQIRRQRSSSSQRARGSCVRPPPGSRWTRAWRPEVAWRCLMSRTLRRRRVAASGEIHQGVRGVGGAQQCAARTQSERTATP